MRWIDTKRIERSLTQERWLKDWKVSWGEIRRKFRLFMSRETTAAFDVSSATSMGHVDDAWASVLSVTSTRLHLCDDFSIDFHHLCVSVPFAAADFFLRLTFKSIKSKLNTQHYQANNNWAKNEMKFWSRSFGFAFLRRRLSYESISLIVAISAKTLFVFFLISFRDLRKHFDKWSINWFACGRLMPSNMMQNQFWVSKLVRKFSICILNFFVLCAKRTQKPKLDFYRELK